MPPCYVAFGDSMSIDSYPDAEAAQLGIEARGLGAASMLYRNDDDVWPEFAHSDLVTMWPELRFANVSQDGAVSGDIVSQLKRARRLEVRLATFTMGGNDLLGAYSIAGKTRRLATLVREARDQMTDAIHAARRALPHALFVLTTVYDPTDGTGMLPPYPERLPLEFLDEMNTHIASLAEADGNALLADVHDCFLGHGLTVSGEEHWYLPGAPIEPGLRGASEIRRVWWEQLSPRVQLLSA